MVPEPCEDRIQHTIHVSELSRADVVEFFVGLTVRVIAIQKFSANGVSREKGACLLKHHEIDPRRVQ